jgi:cytochrome c oxidase subunit II
MSFYCGSLMHKQSPFKQQTWFSHPVPARLSSAFFILLLGSGCSGEQAALAPAGEEAEAIFNLFIVTVVGAGVIWLLVMGLLVYAGRLKRRVHSENTGQALILWGGAIFPAAVLTLLLSYALWLMPSARPWFRGASQGQQIEVTGERFWWRVRYLDQSRKVMFETANEIRIPLGERVSFELKATDVIHSFWIPALAGKMDMIPGRTNVLSLAATRAGTYRAPCAEFCGASHALMTFSVVVMEPSEFQAWMRHQQNLPAPADAAGQSIFAKNGCPACHTVRQSDARGMAGPDLSNFGERPTLGAGVLANTRDNVARFIRDPGLIKPDVHMPSFDMVPDTEIAAMARYVGGLR